MGIIRKILIGLTYDAQGGGWFGSFQEKIQIQNDFQ